MTVALWLIAVALAFGFAYTMEFGASTLAMGRELSGESTGTGYQDAITPPWYTKAAMCVYVGALVLFGVMAWQVGWGSALGSLGVIFFGAMIAKRLLPRAGSPHFVNQIVRSMLSRYADYVRDGDTLRAEAMKGLLDAAGLSPDQQTRA